LFKAAKTVGESATDQLRIEDFILGQPPPGRQADDKVLQHFEKQIS